MRFDLDHAGIVDKFNDGLVSSEYAAGTGLKLSFSPSAKVAAMTWKERVGNLKRDVTAIVLAVRDPRVPWYAKAVGVCVIAYALSPIDLIPDFVPVLGYLDDLVLVPLGLLLTLRLIPAEILAEHRAAAAAIAAGPVSRAGAVAVIAIWVLSATLFAVLLAGWAYHRFFAA
jgi:uncharacterized membrane protein YkvA (DUF1232 family)